jgi:integrase
MAKVRGTVFRRPNGTFTALTDPVWDPKANKNRRPSLGTYETEEEANRALIDYNSGGSSGVFALTEIQQRAVRLDVYMAEWLELVGRERNVGEITLATQRDYETVARLHVVPYLGRRRIGDLTTSVLHSWLLDLRAAGVGDRTVQKALRTLHRALADSELRVNPAKLPKSKRPKVNQRRQGVYPTAQQVDVFLEHVAECAAPYGSRLLALWRIAGTAGLRRAELAGLAWSDVSFSKKTISVNQTLRIDRGGLYVKGPKSENGYRTVRLDPKTLEQLKHHRVIMAKERTRVGATYQREPLGYDFVFRADDVGSPLKPERLTPAFVREWEHAGLPPGPTLHGLRHTNGSELLLSGVSPLDVASHLGHDLQTLNSVYAHELDPANRQEVIAGAIASIYR